MNKTQNVGETQIKSVNLQAADARYYVDNFTQPAGNIDMQRLEDEADAIAVRQCVERRAGRAIREQRRASKASAV